MIGLLSEFMRFHSMKKLYFKVLYRKLGKCFYENAVSEDLLFISTKLL